VLSKLGLLERIAQVEKAPGVPFDHGQFQLITETVDEHAVDTLPMASSTLVQIKPVKRRQPAKELIICRGCDRHVMPGTKVCPFCQGDVRALARQHEKNLREARKAYHRLLKLLPRLDRVNQ
jgi:hypothetical protein